MKELKIHSGFRLADKEEQLKNFRMMFCFPIATAEDLERHLELARKGFPTPKFLLYLTQPKV